MKRMAFLILLPIASTGCFRTVYSNLAPPTSEHVVTAAPTGRAHVSAYWQHFFLYGWVPSEKVIDAAAICGGAEHVKQIETEHSFAQMLVQSFAGFYINIYSPYTGHVACDNTRER